MTEYRQITKLVHPFPDRVVHKNPSGGGVYVKHSTVEQRIIDVLGPVSFEIVTPIRGDLPGIAPNPDGKSQRAKDGTPGLVGVIVGVTACMTATIDGQFVSVVEVGDCESPTNWPHDGARLKDATSDAYKRCAMRIGVGLHLWAQDDFYISAKFLAQDAEAEALEVAEAEPEANEFVADLTPSPDMPMETNA